MPPRVVDEPVEVLLELPRQSRLADARDPDHRDAGERAPPSAVAWNSSLSEAQLAVASDERRLERRRMRPSPPRAATTRSARHSGTGSPLPFSSCVPASSKATAASAARLVASPTSTVPGSAADWMREAVLTRSPATIPWSGRAERHRRLAGEHPAARLERAASSAGTAATSSSAARTARSASSSCATGAPQTAITASPMNFSTVPP